MHDLAIAVAALEQCEANGNSASVAVVDPAGRWRVFLQADNANPHNLESVGNETIGVLGVSGSSSEGDERCAMAGIATVADQLRWEPLRRTRTCFECTAAPGVTVCSVSISAAWTTPDWSEHPSRNQSGGRAFVAARIAGGDHRCQLTAAFRSHRSAAQKRPTKRRRVATKGGRGER